VVTRKLIRAMNPERGQSWSRSFFGQKEEREKSSDYRKACSLHLKVVRLLITTMSSQGKWKRRSRRFFRVLGMGKEGSWGPGIPRR